MMQADAMNRVPTSTVFFQVSPNLHLQLRVECCYIAHRLAGQSQHGFSQVRGRAHDGTAFVNQPLHALIEVKATFATWASNQMRLHYRDFLGAEFPVDIEMETSNSFKTAHVETFFH